MNLITIGFFLEFMGMFMTLKTVLILRMEIKRLLKLEAVLKLNP